MYSVQQQEGGTEEIYEDMTGEHSSTTEPVEVLDESIGEGRTNAFEKKETSERGAGVMERIEKSAEGGPVYSEMQSKDGGSRVNKKREPSLLEDEQLQTQGENLEGSIGKELLIGRSVMQETKGLSDEQAEALALIIRDLSALEKIIAEPARHYPIRNNEKATEVGEELLRMERTARALQDVPECIKKMAETFPAWMKMREYVKHDVKVLRTLAEGRVAEFDREINKFQKAKEKIRNLNEVHNTRSENRIKLGKMQIPRYLLESREQNEDVSQGRWSGLLPIAEKIREEATKVGKEPIKQKCEELERRKQDQLVSTSSPQLPWEDPVELMTDEELTEGEDIIRNEAWGDGRSRSIRQPEVPLETIGPKVWEDGVRCHERAYGKTTIEDLQRHQREACQPSTRPRERVQFHTKHQMKKQGPIYHDREEEVSAPPLTKGEERNRLITRQRPLVSLTGQMEEQASKYWEEDERVDHRHEQIIGESPRTRTSGTQELRTPEVGWKQQDGQVHKEEQGSREGWLGQRLQEGIRQSPQLRRTRSVFVGNPQSRQGPIYGQQMTSQLVSQIEEGYSEARPSIPHYNQRRRHLFNQEQEEEEDSYYEQGAANFSNLLAHGNSSYAGIRGGQNEQESNERETISPIMRGRVRMGEYELSMINKARKLQADMKDIYISTNSIKRINKRLTDIGGLSYQGLTDILVQKDNFEKSNREHCRSNTRFYKSLVDVEQHLRQHRPSLYLQMMNAYEEASTVASVLSNRLEEAEDRIAAESITIAKMSSQDASNITYFTFGGSHEFDAKNIFEFLDNHEKNHKICKTENSIKAEILRKNLKGHARLSIPENNFDYRSLKDILIKKFGNASVILRNIYAHHRKIGVVPSRSCALPPWEKICETAKAHLTLIRKANTLRDHSRMLIGTEAHNNELASFLPHEDQDVILERAGLADPEEVYELIIKTYEARK